MTIKSAVPVDRYLCADCGYSEEWVDTDYIDKIKKSLKINNFFFKGTFVDVSFFL